MKKLATYLVHGITGNSDIKIDENKDGDRTELIVKAPKEFIGLIIGKGGRTIKAIRNVLRIKATLEKKGVFINVEEKED